MITKVWQLLGKVSTHDIETLQRANVHVSIFRDNYTVDASSSIARQYVSDQLEVQITTTCDQEEAWLKLCFGERLYHFSTQYEFDVAKY